MTFGYIIIGILCFTKQILICFNFLILFFLVCICYNLRISYLGKHDNSKTQDRMLRSIFKKKKKFVLISIMGFKNITMGHIYYLQKPMK